MSPFSEHQRVSPGDLSSSKVGVGGERKPAMRWNKLKPEYAFCSSPMPLRGKFMVSSFRGGPIKRPLLHELPQQPRPLQGTRSLINATASLSEPAVNGLNWMTRRNGKFNDMLDFSKLDKRSRRGMHISEGEDTTLKGTELAEFPEGTFLTPSVARSLLEKEGNWREIDDLNLGDETLFALCLLVERAKGEHSEYAGLLDMLPNVNELDSGDFWNEEELELLRGSAVYAKSIGIREAIKEEWVALNASLFESNRDRFNEEDFSLQLYKWALGIVDSRTVSAGRDEARVLAPVLHNLMPPGRARKATGRAEVAGGVFFSKKRIVLKLESDVPGGEEVTISSGEGCFNSDYLVERGSVVEGGASKFEVKLEVAQLDKFYDDKVDIIESRGLEGSTTFEVGEGTESGGSWEAAEDMERFLRLVCLSGADVFLLEGVFRGEVWDLVDLPVSAENERGVCEVIIGACEDAIEEFSKSWDEVEGAGGGEKICERRREMAKVVVEGEKKIASRLLKRYKARLGSLDALEYYAERRLKTLDLLRPVDESEIVDSESGSRIGRAFDENY